MKVRLLFVLFVLFLICSCDNTIRRNEVDNRSINSSSTNYSIERSNGSNNQAQPRKWRENLPGGGYADYIQQADGSLTVTRVEICQFCHGTAVCPACGGVGGRYGSAYGGMYYPCNMCSQSGICNSCKGEGRITTISVTDASGNTTMTSSNGYSAVGGPGGTIVTSPDGRSTGHPSGGGVPGSSSSRHSDNYDTSNDYVETIEYATNYTCEPDDEWCEKCQKIARRHAHIRKRVY